MFFIVIAVHFDKMDTFVSRDLIIMLFNFYYTYVRTWYVQAISYFLPTDSDNGMMEQAAKKWFIICCIQHLVAQTYMHCMKTPLFLYLPLLYFYEHKLLCFTWDNYGY